MRRYVNAAHRKEVIEHPEINRLKAEIRAIRANNAEKRALRKRLKALKRGIKRKHRKERLKGVKVHKKSRATLFIERKAASLEGNLPTSEKWFRELYLKEDIKRTFSEDLFKDEFNRPFNSKYIPDVCNRGYKYIIEIDGSIHSRPDIILKDKIKDYYFTKRGYIVIRVKYGNMDDYKKCIELVKARIAEIEPIEQARRDKTSNKN